MSECQATPVSADLGPAPALAQSAMLQRRCTWDTAGRRQSRLPGQTEPPAVTEPRFGHDFSQMRVCADRGAARADRPSGEMGGKPGMNAVIGASPQEPEGDVESPAGSEAPGGSTEMKESSGSGGSHPFTAVFLIASGSVKSCAVPAGMHGVAKVAKFRVFDAGGKAVKAPLLVEEEFTKTGGSDELFDLLKPVSYRTSNGYFDDCYRLYSSERMPDVGLTVKQNHKISGEIVSENQITFSPSSIQIRVCPRKGRGFGTRCKLY